MEREEGLTISGSQTKYGTNLRLQLSVEVSQV